MALSETARSKICTLVEQYPERRTALLPALKLAEADQESGKMSRGRSTEMSRSVLAVVDELCDHVDVRPASAPAQDPEVQVPAPAGLAACVAGRGRGIVRLDRHGQIRRKCRRRDRHADPLSSLCNVR